MHTEQYRQVTVIYYSEDSLQLQHHVDNFPENQHGRVVLPEGFKQDKSIIAVCDGEVEILNRIGDRIIGHTDVA